MDRTQLNTIPNFIWGIADDVLRDLYVRGKYRDVILPMTFLCRLDAILEPTKQDVLRIKDMLERQGVANADAALRQAAKQVFYNTSEFTLRDLRNCASEQQLRADFEAYLDGFSPTVQEILEKFDFRSQIPRLSKADALGMLIEKFLEPEIDLSPTGLDNHEMGTIFEELIQRFNEESNEKAGEHWTPSDAVKLIAKLLFLPIADQIESGTYLLYDGACGTGGMLTVAKETLQQIASEHGKQVETHLYGQEINSETYAICKANLLLKGEGEEAANVIGGPEYSTLANDQYRHIEFDFMLSNPPYGKSWKSDMERLGGKGNKRSIRDPRFIVEHAGDPEFSLVPHPSDGQLLFLANLVSKMKKESPLGSRIAEVHNGSSLVMGDAGQGESNIRRWVIENDWLEAIIALPLNMFYNTGIATYIWVLTNRKPEHRKGKVQLIDATQWYKPLRKNMGKKNCELSEADIQRICDTFLTFEENEQSKIFPNEAFGYWKVTVERPLRLHFDLSESTRAAVRQYCEAERLIVEGEQGIAELVDWLAGKYGDGPHPNADELRAEMISEARVVDIKLTPPQLKMLDSLLIHRDETADPAVKKRHNPGKVEADPLHGLYEAIVKGKPAIVEYEVDSDLRDTEQIPLLEPGGIEAFFSREVLPHVPDAWINPDATRIGYEISFTRYFYKPQKLRPLEVIRADILALEQETDRLLSSILNLRAGKGK